jgi:fumarylacetoacetase
MTFSSNHLPYGVFSPPGQDPRVGVAIGDDVLDLAQALGDPIFATGSLNAFLATGKGNWHAVRARVQRLIDEGGHQHARYPINEVTLHLPFEVADYVDFFSSQHHAENLGAIFRPREENALTPNWQHLPIGYHGRAGTVVVSGTPVVRPHGQRKHPDAALPDFGPTQKLDIEAELGFVVGTPSKLGQPVPLAEFADHVFGVTLVNDWSARDIQAWEYVPLGPFLGKSFSTSISPWITPLQALEQARVPPPPRAFQLHDYLDDSEHPWGLDITLTVQLNGEVVSHPPTSLLYWTAPQQLAHITVNGASLRTGDLYASGTISGPNHDERGSLIELTWNGKNPIKLPDGTTRSFLQDGDEVVITATAPGIGQLGEVRGTITSAVRRGFRL